MTTEDYNYTEEKSILEDASIAATGVNPFAQSDVWWYIIGIAVFGLLGSNFEIAIFQLLKYGNFNSFFKEQSFTFFLYIILPFIFLLFSKIFLLVFIYKKWKFVAQTNAESPYGATVVWEKYIRPIIYFFVASIVLAFLTALTRNGGAVSFFALIRGLLLLSLSIYLIIWNYRLLVEFPKYFNPISITIHNSLYKLPKKIGLFLWLTPIIANVFLYLSYFLFSYLSKRDGDFKSYRDLTQSLDTLWNYATIVYFIVLAIYIYVVINTSKQVYQNNNPEY
jgi:hypothetical protein